jgi:transcriptional regulator with XRE-family HTH domain
METSQSSIARLESGTSLPSMRTLTKFAKATNTEINIVIGVCTNRERICMALTLINKAPLFDLV